MWKLLSCLAILCFCWACAKTEPTPVIFDLVDGVVTTEQFTEVPLASFGREGVTQVMLVPIGELANDPTLGPLSTRGRSYAVAAGTYALGFEPNAFLAPTTRAGTYTATPAASLSEAAVQGFDSTSTAGTIAAQIQSNYNGQRVMLVGEQKWLAEVGAILSGGAFESWPLEGESALVFITQEGETRHVQTFGVNINRE